MLEPCGWVQQFSMCCSLDWVFFTEANRLRTSAATRTGLTSRLYFYFAPNSSSVARCMARQQVSPPIWSRLSYLNCHVMDCYDNCGHLWLPLWIVDPNWHCSGSSNACRCNYLLHYTLTSISLDRNTFINIGEESAGFGLRATDFETIIAHGIFWLSNLAWNQGYFWHCLVIVKWTGKMGLRLMFTWCWKFNMMMLVILSPPFCCCWTQIPRMHYMFMYIHI